MSKVGPAHAAVFKESLLPFRECWESLSLEGQPSYRQTPASPICEIPVYIKVGTFFAGLFWYLDNSISGKLFLKYFHENYHVEDVHYCYDEIRMHQLPSENLKWLSYERKKFYFKAFH